VTKDYVMCVSHIMDRPFQPNEKFRHYWKEKSNKNLNIS